MGQRKEASQRRRDSAVSELADIQGGLVRVAQLRELGVSRGRQRAQVAGGRWSCVPYRGVLLAHDDEQLSRWWSAVAVSGTDAALGGTTALHAAGLEGYCEERMHIWVRKSSRVVRTNGIVVHETRRWNEVDVMPAGIRRSTSSVATIQAALWASTPRQAVLALVMPVQQRLVRAADVAVELSRVKRHRYAAVLRAALGDVIDGAQSLNELDFAALCRSHGLPEPTRQRVARTPEGRCYLDVSWDRYGVALEVNGIGHGRVEQILKDNFRAIDLQLRGETVIELSVLTLRARPDEAMARVGAVLRARGWSGVRDR